MTFLGSIICIVTCLAVTTFAAPVSYIRPLANQLSLTSLDSILNDVGTGGSARKYIITPVARLTDQQETSMLQTLFMNMQMNGFPGAAQPTNFMSQFTHNPQSRMQQAWAQPQGMMMNPINSGWFSSGLGMGMGGGMGGGNGLGGLGMAAALPFFGKLLE